MLHICGIALSTSELSRQNAIALAKKSYEKEIAICFDFNFRSSLNDEESIVETFMLKYYISVFAGTYRHQSNHQKQLQGFIYQGSEKTVSEKVAYEVWDRIGTGGAFVAGILTGLIEKWPLEKTVKFGVYNAALAHTTVGDSPVLSKSFVLNYMENQVDVIR